VSLSFDDAERLRAAGFVNWEIGRFSEAKTPDEKDQPPIDINTPIWGRVMESRRSWTDDKIVRGWAKDEIENAIMDYYRRNPEKDPWSFLKAEYKPPLKKDYYEAVRAREQRQINIELGKYY